LSSHSSVQAWQFDYAVPPSWLEEQWLVSHEHTARWIDLFVMKTAFRNAQTWKTFIYLTWKQSDVWFSSSTRREHSDGSNESPNIIAPSEKSISKIKGNCNMWMNTLQKMWILAYVIHKIKEWFRASSENRDAFPMINASLFDCYNQHGFCRLLCPVQSFHWKNDPHLHVRARLSRLLNVSGCS
jgi:hypothetical protein